MRLPANIRVGQVRRTVTIVSPEEWRSLTGDERAAADALALHVWWRCRQKQHPALEDETACSSLSAMFNGCCERSAQRRRARRPRL